jgi:hypothetical protein
MKHDDLKPEALSSNMFWMEINPSHTSCQNLKNELQKLETQGLLLQVINLSSRAVLHLNSNHKRIQFYQIWINALEKLEDKASLTLLGKHLYKMRYENSAFRVLALMAFLHAEQEEISKSLMTKIQKINKHTNRMYKSAIHLYEKKYGTLKSLLSYDENIDSSFKKAS